MRLSNVDTGRMTGLKYKLICHFKLAVDMIRGGISSLRPQIFLPASSQRCQNLYPISCHKRVYTPHCQRDYKTNMTSRDVFTWCPQIIPVTFLDRGIDLSVWGFVIGLQNFVNSPTPMPPPTMSDANLKHHINLYFNPVSLPVSTFDNLTKPPLPLFLFSPLASAANTLVSHIFIDQ